MGYSLAHGDSMKVGDIVVRTSEDLGLHNFPMIYMGIGLWTGWIRVYCPKDRRIISVRKTYVRKVMI